MRTVGIDDKDGAHRCRSTPTFDWWYGSHKQRVRGRHLFRCATIIDEQIDLAGLGKLYTLRRLQGFRCHDRNGGHRLDLRSRHGGFERFIGRCYDHDLQLSRRIQSGKGNVIDCQVIGKFQLQFQTTVGDVLELKCSAILATCFQLYFGCVDQ